MIRVVCCLLSVSLAWSASAWGQSPSPADLTKAANASKDAANSGVMALEGLRKPVEDAGKAALKAKADEAGHHTAAMKAAQKAKLDAMAVVQSAKAKLAEVAKAATAANDQAKKALDIKKQRDQVERTVRDKLLAAEKKEAAAMLKWQSATTDQQKELDNLAVETAKQEVTLLNKHLVAAVAATKEAKEGVLQTLQASIAAGVAHDEAKMLLAHLTTGAEMAGVPSPANAPGKQDETPGPGDQKIPPKAPPMVFPLIVGDGADPRIGAGVQVNSTNLQALLRRAFKGQGIATTRLVGVSGGPQLTAANVFAAINQIKSDPLFTSDSTIFCYWMSHGGHATGAGNQSRWEYGHFMQINRHTENVLRSNLFEALLDARGASAAERGAGLTVLITETCNTAVAMPGAQPAFASPLSASTDAEVLWIKRLLTEYQGQVSVSATSTNELGWYYPDRGGFFTEQFTTYQTTATNLTWERLIEDCSNEAKLTFEQAFPNQTNYLNRYRAESRDPNLRYSYTAQWMRSKDLVTPRQ